MAMGVGYWSKTEFNVPVLETDRLGNIFMSSFLKRELSPPKVMVLFVGVPWPKIIMKHSVYIQVRFGSYELDLVWNRGKLIRPDKETTNSDITR